MRTLIFVLVFCFNGLLFARTQDSIQVFAASSLKKPLDLIIEKFKKESDLKIKVNYGASGALATQIEFKQKWDLFFSADSSYIEKIKKNHPEFKNKNFLTDEIVLVISPQYKNEALKSTKDLLIIKPRLGLSSTSAPLGDYTVKALKKMKLYELILKEKLIQTTPATANQLSMIINENQIDAGFIYKSSAEIFNLKILDHLDSSLTGPIYYGWILNSNSDQVNDSEKFLNYVSKNLSEFQKWGWRTLE